MVWKFLFCPTAANVLCQSIIRYLRVIGLCHFFRKSYRWKCDELLNRFAWKQFFTNYGIRDAPKNIFTPTEWRHLKFKAGTSATRKYWLFWCYESQGKHSHRDRNTLYNCEQTNRRKVEASWKLLEKKTYILLQFKTVKSAATYILNHFPYTEVKQFHALFLFN